MRGIRIPGGAKYSRKDIDDITKLAVSFGAKALANIIYNEDGTAKSPVLKFVTDEQLFRNVQVLKPVILSSLLQTNRSLFMTLWED